MSVLVIEGVRAVTVQVSSPAVSENATGGPELGLADAGAGSDAVEGETEAAS